MLTLLLLLGCRTPAPPRAQAEAPVPTAPPVSSGDGPTGPETAETRSPPAGGAAPAVAPDAIELVAVGGRSPTTTVALGHRVWLSGGGVDATADGDGPLAKGPDLLRGLPYELPYEPSKHAIDVVGAYPRLFAMRTKRVNGRVESPEATVFVRARSGLPWVASRPLGRASYPQAFVAWSGGALLVDSQIEHNASPSYEPSRPGTSFTRVAADGTVTHPNLGLERPFMAWGASSDGETLSMIGTRGLPPDADGKAVTGGRDLVLVRGKAHRALKTTVIVPDVPTDMNAYPATVREFGSAAVVWVPSPLNMAEMETTMREGASVLVVADGPPTKRKLEEGDAAVCRVTDAALVGSLVYAIVDCVESEASVRLVRIGASGPLERVTVPALARKRPQAEGYRVAAKGDDPLRCVPRRLVVRAPEDLWIEARCGGDDPPIAAVFRRVGAQEPIVFP